MTTEDDFQAALDAHPDDHDTRKIFADWLQDRDDPRAEGYRALGVLRKRPFTRNGRASWYNAAVRDGKNDPQSDLPGEWFREIPKELNIGEWMRCPTRRAAEDAAALAFAQLPAARRAELLNSEVTS